MKFGIAVCDITPPFKTYMHGYSSRNEKFKAINDNLTFTAIVIDEGSRRMLLGCADLCCFPNHPFTDRLRIELAEDLECNVSRIMLNASHTHGGPQLPSVSFSSKLSKSKSSAKYAAWLKKRIRGTAQKAIKNMTKATLWFGEGISTLPVNRRMEKDGRILLAPNPAGPVDDRLQLLVFKDMKDKILAVGMKISCHPVSTGAQYNITADYPGAWRQAFREHYGDNVIPFFLQGAGGDMRPSPTVDGNTFKQMEYGELPEIGKKLLSEMTEVLEEKQTALKPINNLILQGCIKKIAIPCEHKYTTRKSLEALFRNTSEYYEKEYARECLRRMEAGENIPDHMEYLIHTICLNNDYALIGINAEPLIGLGYKIEQQVKPEKAIFLGYTNGCVSYLPDSFELKRGGYESEAYLFEPATGPFKPGLENLLVEGLSI